MAIEPASDDSIKGYDMQQHIQTIVDLARTRTYRGYIEAISEEGDQWRIGVVNGRDRAAPPDLAGEDQP